jgi:hypothetical protein
MITCRVCEAKSRPFDDAVLLCRECRSQAYLLPVQVRATLATSEERLLALFQALTLPDVQRTKVINEARWDAECSGTLAAWERRVQATIRQGGPLAEYLEARLSYLRVKAWHDTALEELAAYADEHRQEAA